MVLGPASAVDLLNQKAVGPEICVEHVLQGLLLSVGTLRPC